MRKLVYLFIALLLISCGGSTFKKTDNGIIVPIKSTGEQVRLQVYNNEIIRVTIAKPNQPFSEEKSLVTVMEPTAVDWKLAEAEGYVTISTVKIDAKVNTKTGEVQFFDKTGKIILKEIEGGGRAYGSAVAANLPETTMQVVFDSPADEAFYGLGQHQNGEVNYKGLDVELQQNNIVAVVPFLYSKKNYGLLIDNYSITRFGDPRDYEQISSLELFDATGNPGGLTANYYDGNNKLVVSQVENTLNYTTLVEQKNFPQGYKIDEKSTIVWEGDLQAKSNGVHKFKLWAAGYYKVWVDGNLLMNKWRQCWNPWFNKFNIDMKAGEKHHLKVEWKPDAGVSYIGLTYLDAAYADKQQKLSISSEAGKQIDYYFVKGENADEVISGYRTLTGKAPIVPKWAMGLWQSRERYKSQDQLVDVVREYRKRGLPLDNIVLDWNYWPTDKWGDHDFDPQFWPNPEQMTKDIHGLNANIMISVWPKFYVGTNNFNLMKEKGWLYMKNVELGNLDWIGKGYLSTFYDAFNPEARAAYWKSMNEKLFSKGFDAWWLDATEPDIHSNVTLAEKKSTMTPNYLGDGTEYFNTYSLQTTKGVYEGQREADPSKRVFILTRSAFAGQQRYGATTWSGDIVSRWDNLRNQWAAGINMAISGIPYWTTDIGGFAVERRYERPNDADLKEWRELNVRWYQFGVFNPLFRIHGQFPLREIWNIAPEGTSEYKTLEYYDKLRYRMMPYIYSLAGQTYHNNYTIMRGLFMDFGTDQKVENIADQFMFGPSLMVCPVGEYGQRNRNAYLPKGAGWYDFYTNNYFEGGQSLNAEAPLERIPLFVKAGSIVPCGPEIQYTTQPTNGLLKVVVYTGADGKFELYEDENINYNYEKGAFSVIPLTYNDAEKSLTVGERNGQFEGMSKERTIEVYFIEKGKVLDLNAKADASVTYNGKPIEIKK
jgi:alpha-D-xyloside xylohydrolase